ncbi:hypothetical protein B0H17DRAFT_922353, partial [Mycena rosella]
APGFHPHLPGRGYTLLAKGVGATMWFFIFYRLRYCLSRPSTCSQLTHTHFVLRKDGGKLMVCPSKLYSVAYVTVRTGSPSFHGPRCWP